jgi:hypothetical protein
MRPGQPAAIHAFVQALFSDRIFRGDFSPPRLVADHPKEHVGADLSKVAHQAEEDPRLDPAGLLQLHV